jgi:hypothetical protein
MKTTNNQTKKNEKELNLEPFKEFLTEYVTPLELSEILDEIQTDYSVLLLEKQERITEKTGSYIHFIYQIRKLLEQC